MTTILVVDDDADVRAALASVIRRQPELRLIGAASSHGEALALATGMTPDVVLMDVKMNPGGPFATRAILRAVPTVKIVAFSAHDDRGAVLEMVDAGAVGYVIKGGSVKELLAAVRAALDGQTPLSSAASSTVLDELSSRLSAERQSRMREREREQLVRRAMGGLRIVFQPVVDLQHGGIVGWEALSRFDDPPGHTPATVYAAAQGAALGPHLEALAVSQALDHLDSLRPHGFLSVNASPGALLSNAFDDLLDRRLDGVVLEITEHAPVDDYHALRAALGPWRQQGTRVAVDDAGAGFASFRHILELAPDFVKLDGSLTGGLEAGTPARAMAAALATFARETSTSIIAEGIEKARQVEALVAMGIVLGQGYLLGAPEPVATSAATSGRASTYPVRSALRNQPRSTCGSAPSTASPHRPGRSCMGT